MMNPREASVDLNFTYEGNEIPSEALVHALKVIGLDALNPGCIALDFRVPLIQLASSWEKSIAPSTLASRRCDLRRFLRWCDNRAQLPFASGFALSELMEAHVADVGQTLSSGTTQRVGSSLTALAKTLGSDRASRGAKERRRLAVRAAQKSNKANGKSYHKPRLTVAQMQTMRTNMVTASSTCLRAVRDLAIFDTMCDILARRSEITDMVRGDIDLAAGTVRISYSKTDQSGRGITFAISPRTVASIEAWLDASGLKYIDAKNLDRLPLFSGVMNDQKIRFSSLNTPEPMDSKTVARSIQRYAMPLGIPGVSGHSLRRSMARALYEAGVPEDEIVKKGRWSSLDQMRDYVGVTSPIQGAAALII